MDYWYTASTIISNNPQNTMISLKNFDLKNTNIAIMGAGTSGYDAAKLASINNPNVTIYDDEKRKLKNKKIKIVQLSPNTSIENIDIVIKSPGIPQNNNFIVRCRNKKIPIVSEIEFASWLSKIKIIGITGSNGKSTCVKLLKNILDNANIPSYLGGNIGTSFSSNVIKELKQNSKVLHILELSSFQLEDTFTFSPFISCIINISRDHMDRYKKFEDYLNAKLNLVKCSDNINGHIFFNDNDPILSKKLKKHKRAIPFNSNQIPIEEISPILMGKHNLENISAIYSICQLLKIDKNIIINTINNFNPLKHRLEKIIAKNGITCFNDSKATNIISMISAINSFEKDVVLIIGGYDKEKTSFLNSLTPLKNKINKIYCYGESGKRIYLELNKKFKSEYIKSFEEIVPAALKKIKENETLLLSPGCASYDQFDNFEKRGEKFISIIKKYDNI